MAIYSSVPPPAQQAASGVDVQAWTAEALQSLSISPSAVGTGVALAIPLGEEKEEQKAKVLKVRKEKDAVQGLKRDSLRTREKLRMGKEGSRRRQRWENGWFCFLSVFLYFCLSSFVCLISSAAAWSRCLVLQHAPRVGTGGRSMCSW